ncbi:Disintegrin and metalloproteinase domain-containing protein 17 [Desmophyllum pertusum]|uniref:Disintegrin and metalloproteinase domain-containing protein 17 n=1 Tax=Desmophyllum pertusum TaxID=174260 RepID=A0A9W9YEQ4_9CNID|nr:Disintegrin and metalloproteinase domain-containing protein 17 [Desmophyllum pertusum]
MLDISTHIMRGISCLQTCLFIATLCCISAANTGNIGDVLRHYETLNTVDILYGFHKRDVNKQEKIVSFTTLERHFRLHLTPHSELFAENFHAYSIGEYNQRKEVTVDKESFYRGYDEGDPSSHASVYVDHGVITASIATKNDTYFIEPAWRHIGQSSNQQMISYRHSDVKSNVTNPHQKDPKKKTFSFCGHDSDHSTVLYMNGKAAPEMRSERRRRAAPTKIRCSVALVADFRFFNEMGQGSKRKTINYMIGVVDRVDSIFQRTTWSDQYKGYGFEIEEVIVHEKPTPSVFHYNMDTAGNKPWPIKPLLNAFSRNSEWQKYCLAHLFTYQDFDDGVIGLAYVGNPNRNAVGGVCTQKYFTNNTWLYLNTGLSSGINWDRKLLTEEADIVTAHGT